MCHCCVFQWHTHLSARWYLIHLLKMTHALADVRFASDLFAQMPKAWFQLDNIWIHALFSSLAPCRLNPTFVGSGGFLPHLVWCWQVTFHPCRFASKLKPLLKADGWAQPHVFPSCLQHNGWCCQTDSRLHFFFFFFHNVSSQATNHPWWRELSPCVTSAANTANYTNVKAGNLRAKSEVRLRGRSFNDSPDFSDVSACVSHCVPDEAKH